MNRSVAEPQVLLLTGARKGIGRYLAEHYVVSGYLVVGCSRAPSLYKHDNYFHFCADVADEAGVETLFAEIRSRYGRLHILINNAGIASMNHVLLTPVSTAKKILDTNVLGTFLFCREAAKLMRKQNYGRIVNFSTVATPLKLEGEAIYAASKAAVVTLTKIMAFELASFGIRVNAVGPTPVKTDLVRSVPQSKIDALIARQAIKRWGEFKDIANVIDFFIKPESDFVTGQIVYLGGVSND
jgi:3-oxoacyl-[acyl-carrier protein] reductase